MTEPGLTVLDPRAMREAEENPRAIRDDRLEQLAYSLDADPAMLEARPIILDADDVDGDGRFAIVAGNMRQRAALLLLERDPGGRFAHYLMEHGGLPAYVKRFDSAAERREWMLRDNQAYGEWVPDELARLVALHQDEGADMALLGMSEGELGGLLALAEEPPAPRGTGDPDDAPPPPEEPVTALGDVWRLGDHVVVCGDAEKPEDIERLLTAGGTEEAVAVDLIWTDPPYGVGYDPEKRAGVGELWDFGAERKAKPLGEIKGDELRTLAAYGVWLTAVLKAAAPALRPGGAIYICHADKMVEAVAAALREAGFFYAQQIIWLKNVMIFGRSDYHFKHEPILYGWKLGAAHRWLGDRTQTTIIEASLERDYVHSTQKPYELVRPALENSTEPHDVVLDLFGGSGTTLIACERLSRRAFLMELDRRYVDVIVQRWQAFTGEQAELLVRGPEPVTEPEPEAVAE